MWAPGTVVVEGKESLVFLPCPLIKFARGKVVQVLKVPLIVQQEILDVEGVRELLGTHALLEGGVHQREE